MRCSSRNQGVICACLLVLLVGLPTTGAYGEEQGGDDDGDNDAGVVVITRAPGLAQTPAEDVLDDGAVEAVGARSAQDILRSMPGLQLSQHGSEGKAAQIFLRGFDAAHGTDVTLSIDGMTLNEPSHIHGHGYADSGLIIPEVLRAVRLRTGPFDLDQGNFSTAGDVDFNLGVPLHRRGTAVGAEAGWPFRGRLWAYDAPRDGAEGEFMAAEVVEDQGPFANRQTHRGGVLVQQQFGGWQVRGAVQRAEFGLPGTLPLADVEAGRMDAGDTYTPETSGQTAQIWLGGSYRGGQDDWSHSTSIDLRGRSFEGRENFTGFFFDDVAGDERREYQRAIAIHVGHQSTWDVHKSWDLLLFAGAGVDRFQQFEDAINDQGQAASRRRGGHGWQVNAYAAPGFRGEPADWLRIQGGLRVESIYFDFREDEALGGRRGTDVVAVVAPRLRSRAFVGDHWEIFAAAGRGYRGPEARVFVADGQAPADTDLRLHRGGRADFTVLDAGELGLSFQPTDSMEWTLSLFGYFSDAEYIYDHVSRLQVDLGATRRLGAELKAKLAIGSRTHLQGHISVVDARFVADDTPIPFAPPIEAGLLGYGQLPRGFFTGAEWRAMGARPLPFGAQAAGWNLFNAHLGWANQNWEMRLLVDNVLGTQWREGVYHYASHFDEEQPRSSLPSIHIVQGHPRMGRLQISYRW